MEAEVLVVGGGPAGATLAALLSQRGRRVCLLERERFPRFSVGESLLPKSCEVFEQLGLMDELDRMFLRKYGARFVSVDGREVRYVFAEAFLKQHDYAFQVRRDAFDAMLLNRARELGAAIHQPCKVTEVIFDGDRAVGVRTQTEAGSSEIRAQVVVDAGGRSSILSRRAGVRRLRGLEMSAMFAHFRGVPRPAGEPAGDVVVCFFEHGWFWLIPFRGDITSVGAVMDRRWMATRDGASNEEFFEKTWRATPHLAAKLAGAERTTEVRAAADFSYAVDRIAGDGWISVGDAAGFIDPLFSSGAHLAMRGADVAAKAVDEALQQGDTSAAAFAGYERAIKGGSNLFLGVVQAAYDGELRELLFVPDQRRGMRRIITSTLAGDVVHTPDEPAPRWVRFVRERYPAQLVS